MRVPLNMLSELITLKDYIIDVDADISDNMLILYVECVSSEACRKLKDIVDQVRGALNE